jgi:hypothetical protein
VLHAEYVHIGTEDRNHAIGGTVIMPNFITETGNNVTNYARIARGWHVKRKSPNKDEDCPLSMGHNPNILPIVSHELRIVSD